MSIKILILQCFLTFFSLKNTLQAQEEICSRCLSRISEISIDSESLKVAKDSLKKAELLLEILKKECPRKLQLLSAHFKIGELYEEIGLVKKAIAHYKTIAKIEKPNEWELEYTYNRVRLLKSNACQQIAEIYLAQRKFAKVEAYVMRFFLTRRKIIGCGFGRGWRYDLLDLQLRIALAKNDYADAALLLRRFTNRNAAISTADTILFPFFLEVVTETYSKEEQKELLEKAVKSLKKSKNGVVAKYDLIKIEISTPALRKQREHFQAGRMQLKYLQKAAGRTLVELLSS